MPERPDQPAVSPPSPADVATVRAHVAAHAEDFTRALAEWVAIPSVSADPVHASDVERSARWLAEQLTEAGFPTVELWPAGTAAEPGPLAVFAEWPSEDADAPTVLVYGHHDVQPAAIEDGWAHDPFSPSLDGEVLRGRGASDDKGQVLFHTLAVRAHLAVTGRTTPAVHLKLLVEGEEENGSPHFRALLERERQRLAADVVVVSDTGIWSRDLPTTVTAMRGHIDCQIDLQGPEVDVHSGSFGGAIPNPLHELAALLAGLHDEQGRVTVDGFYDDVLPLSDAERALFAKLPFDEEAWLRNARSTAAYGEAGFSTLERVWARPTAEVNGMWGGYTGAGHKTIIPATAHAKLSFRLVADQDPARIQRLVRDWVAARLPEGITGQVTFSGPGGRACHTPHDHPAVDAVRRALGASWGTEALVTREGGSGPEADIADVLDAPVVFLGAVLPDDGYHGPNEKVEIPMLLKAAEATAHLWADLPTALRQ